MLDKPVIFSIGGENTPEAAKAFFQHQQEYGPLFRRGDVAWIGIWLLLFAIALTFNWGAFGFATAAWGIIMEITAGMALATGVLRLERQPVRVRFRYQTFVACTYWGFKTEDERRLAVANRIRRAGRLLFWGFTLQLLGMTLSEFVW